MVAKQGLQETAPNGDRFLVMLNGTRYEGIPGQLDYKVVEFKRYAMRIEAAEAKKEDIWQNALSTLYLIQNPTNWNLAELEWRLGLPLSALVLSLLAIPLSFVNPRVGRSLNLVMAILIYMIYNNMISVTNAWVGQGKIGAVMGLMGIHSLMFAFMMLLFFHRTSTFSFRRFMR